MMDSTELQSETISLQNNDETQQATDAIQTQCDVSAHADDVTVSKAGAVEEVGMPHEEVVTSAEEPPIPEAIQEEEVAHECGDSVSMTSHRYTCIYHMVVWF